MEKSKPEQVQSAYAASVKRRIADMREKLGMGAASAHKENGAPKQEAKAHRATTTSQPAARHNWLIGVSPVAAGLPGQA